MNLFYEKSEVSIQNSHSIRHWTYAISRYMSCSTNRTDKQKADGSNSKMQQSRFYEKIKNGTSVPKVNDA